MTMLSVNLNKVALLRNARHLDIPNVCDAARTCVAAGADGITVHPRPDERHIRRSDVRDLAAMLDVEFNIEGYPDDHFLSLVEEVQPTQCTLVPDSPAQRTSDHGWVLERDGDMVKSVVDRLKPQGIRTSLFIDADTQQIERALDTGAERVELYTEPYAAAFGGADEDRQFARYQRAAARATELGLGVNAGHDLNLENLPRFVTIADILECSIGHALIADALWLGLENTVKRYRAILHGSVKRPSRTP